MGGAVSYERGTPVPGFLANKADCRVLGSHLRRIYCVYHSTLDLRLKKKKKKWPKKTAMARRMGGYSARNTDPHRL